MTAFENLCMNCMTDMADNAICPSCGFHTSEPQLHHALPYKTMLEKRYIVGRAKKQNGEGFSYIGYDTVLNLPIEIREFFPDTLCERRADLVEVRVMDGSEIPFQEYRSAFLSYAREIAHMRELSSIEHIYDIFEENQTAYTISEWNERITLRYFVERSGGNLSWNDARQLFMPVLSSLSVMHSKGIGHYGISPDSLNIMKDGKMKLGDFSIPAVRQIDTGLPADMVAGCAAIEQYVMNAPLSEETDIYGFSASLFFALTGELPHDALKRQADGKLLISTVILRNIPPHVVTALANALQVDREKRTHTFERLRAELSAAPTVTATIEDTHVLKKIPPIYTEKEAGTHVDSLESKRKRRIPLTLWIVLPCIAVCAGIIIALLVQSSRSKAQPMETIQLTQESAHVFSSAPIQAEKNTAAAKESDKLYLAQAYGDSTVTEQKEMAAPNLINQDYESLTVSLKNDASYEVLLSGEVFNDTIPQGYIVSQSPMAGETMYQGGSIVVEVSRGPAQRVLPSVKGLSLAEACDLVTARGFTILKTEQYDDAIPAQHIIGYQKAQEGETLPYGTTVTLVMSKGPELAGSTP